MMMSIARRRPAYDLTALFSAPGTSNVAPVPSRTVPMGALIPQTLAKTNDAISSARLYPAPNTLERISRPHHLTP